MNKEQYNNIIDEVYKNYRKFTHDKNEKNGNFGEYSRWGDNPLIAGVQHLTKESFILRCKIDTEFSEKWGLKIEERELSLEERYNIWFNNNYETGMERYFNPNNLPDFDNEYYEPTPTKLITVTYNNIKTEIYE